MIRASRCRGAPLFSILGPRIRLCDGISRRELLRVGGLAFTGLTWPDRARAETDPVPTSGRGPGFGKARSCILVHSYGGPSHLDVWDPKSQAPREIRGEFQSTATRVPGFQVGEHLPWLARLADRYSFQRGL